MEEEVKPWVYTLLANRDSWVYGRLDSFEIQKTRQLDIGQTLDIVEIKAKVDEIKRIFVELYD